MISKTRSKISVDIGQVSGMSNIEGEKMEQLQKEMSDVNVSDIDDRLSKLQDLLKYAKS